jgi:hypothetical protein
VFKFQFVLLKLCWIIFPWCQIQDLFYHMNNQYLIWSSYLFHYKKKPCLWCNSEHACLECSRLWVQVPVRSNQRLLNWYLLNYFRMMSLWKSYLLSKQNIFWIIIKIMFKICEIITFYIIINAVQIFFNCWWHAPFLNMAAVWLLPE